MRTPNRAAAIVLKDSSVLLMHRINRGKEYWVFPGGGIEHDETPEQAVVRELMEETTLDVAVDRLLYVHRYKDSKIGDSTHYFYLCTYKGGDPQLGASEEKEEMDRGDQYYEPVFVDVAKIDTLLLYPLEIRDWLIHDLASGFSSKPREATLRTGELRQSI